MTKAEVLAFIKEYPMWTLSSYGEDGPHAIPLRWHTVLEDGKLLTCVVFTGKTIENLKTCDKVCVSVFSVANNHPIGYNLYGKAEYYAAGPYAEIAAEVCAPVANEGFVPKGGAIVIDVDKIAISSPGPTNHTIIE